MAGRTEALIWPEALASLPSHYWVVILITAAIRQSVSILVLTLSLRRKHIL